MMCASPISPGPMIPILTVPNASPTVVRREFVVAVDINFATRDRAQL